MGQAARRRRNKRRKRLAHLAKTDPKKFRKEWALRINSWAEDIQITANKLVDRDGNPVPVSFNIVDSAVAELEAIARLEDEPVIEEAIRTTTEVLTGHCCKQVANVVDKRLYKN
jgi:hypothetical protein